jgi:hypothetical protein
MHWLKSGLHTRVNFYLAKHKLFDENKKEKKK